MSRLLRPAVLAAALAAGALIAGCGDDDDKDKTKTTTGTTASQQARARTRTTSTSDQGGAQVTSGPGSASTLTAGDDSATGAPAQAGIGASSTTGILRPFSDASPWNVQVTAQPVDQRSEEWVRRAQIRRGVQEDGNIVRTRDRRVTDGLFVNTRKWTVPIVDETSGVATRVVCRQLLPYCGDGQNVTQLQVPPTEDPLPQYDGWFTVLNRAQGVAYDMWRARRAPGTNVISYQFMRKWDLNGPGFQEPNTVSARGSGLPLFAGLILPEEIQAGRIDHALAISLPGPAQRRYVQPASATDGVGDLDSIPEGARVRLKRNVALTFARCAQRTREQIAANPQPPTRCLADRTSRRAAQAIFRALRTYGAIVVDRSAVPTLYAKLNFDWTQPLRDANGRLLDASGRPLNRFVRRLPNQGTPLLRGNEVQQLRISDFEVVQVRGDLLRFPPASTSVARTPSVTTPTATTTTATTPTTTTGTP